MGATLEWWLNLAALLGIAILAVPVWSLNTRKKRLQQIRGALTEPPEAFRDRVRTILREKRSRAVADWRRLDEICLIAGYLLLLGSAIARLFVPVA